MALLRSSWRGNGSRLTSKLTLAGILVATVGVRLLSASTLPDRAPPRVLLHRPWQHPPLLDLLTLPLANHRGAVSLALSVASVLLCGLLAREALGRRGALATMGLAALCPALVFSGSFWGHHAPVIPAITLLAVLLARQLSASGPVSSAAIAIVTAASLLSDWPAWAPILAWTCWLAVFRPPQVPKPAARAALKALCFGVAATLPVYVWMLVDIGDPGFALGAKSVPVGLAALESLLDAVAGLFLGDPSSLSLALRCSCALAVIASLAIGGVRASRHGNHCWSGVLLVGTAGAFIPALAIHPWLPIAAGKNLWYMSPMVLCLALSAVWPSPQQRGEQTRRGTSGPMAAT